MADEAKPAFDRRLTPARPDLAALHLQGQVAAARYVAGRPMQIAAPVADVKSAPAPDASLDTQALRGERVTVYEDHEGWAWAQLARDGYVGYLPSQALRETSLAPTHRIAVALTFLYPGPNMKLPPLAALPFGAQAAVTDTAGDFSKLDDGGFVFAKHLESAHIRAPDFVSIAEGYLGAPYLWGGKTPQGVDCSGLVQCALHSAGIDCPRDTDMQQRALGDALDPDAPLSRGDLVFWKGHVGIMRDRDTLLHANGFHMLVASEAFASARARIAAASFGHVTGFRRLTGIKHLA